MTATLSEPAATYSDVLAPGDIAVIPYGVNREPISVCIHSVHTYPSGDMSVRYRYAENPKGVDWSGFIKHGDPDVRIKARGISQVDTITRTMLP